MGRDVESVHSQTVGGEWRVEDSMPASKGWRHRAASHVRGGAGCKVPGQKELQPAHTMRLSQRGLQHTGWVT